MTSKYLTGLVALLCTGVIPTPAWACGYSVESWVLPDGSNGLPVPTNTRIWVYYEGWEGELEELTQDQIALQDESGRPVPTSFSKIAVRGNAIERRLYVLTPAQPLEPMSTYSVALGGMGDSRATVFTTGAGPDLNPPKQPREIKRTGYADGGDEESSCGAYSNVRVEYQMGDVAQELLVAKLDDFDMVSVEQLTGTLHAVSYAPESSWQESLVEYGTGAWAGWPEDHASRRATASIGAFDLAGNFSGWSEPTEIKRKPVPTGWCSVSAAGSSQSTESIGMLALLLTSCFVVRRKCKLGCSRRDVE